MIKNQFYLLIKWAVVLHSSLIFLFALFADKPSVSMIGPNKWKNQKSMIGKAWKQMGIVMKAQVKAS